MTGTAFSGGANSNESTSRGVAAEFVSEDDSGETVSNEMKIAAANARRRDSDVFALARGFFDIDDRNVSLGRSDCAHNVTLVDVSMAR